MRIGIYPTARPSDGGIYYYSQTMISALGRLDHPAAQFLLLETSTPAGPEITDIPRATLPGSPVRVRLVGAAGRIVGEGPHRNAWRRWRHSRPIDPDVPGRQPAVKRHLEKLGLDLLVFPAPAADSFEIGLPFLMPVHDIQHRLNPQFPEVAEHGEWQHREYLYRNAARQALLLLVDSEVGKEDLLTSYSEFGLSEERVRVLPFLPAHRSRRETDEELSGLLLERLGVNRPYFFYPAQFWPHKNHLRLIEALALLTGRGAAVDLVLTGSHDDPIRRKNFSTVMGRARDLGVLDRVKNLGHVPSEEFDALYWGATALVMPTFFGPTNIPPLEAWSFGCPVITSDIRGIGEQMGDAALLVDPTSVEEIAGAMERVLGDSELRETLARRGYARLQRYTPADYEARLLDIMNKAMTRVAVGDVGCRT